VKSYSYLGHSVPRKHVVGLWLALPIAVAFAACGLLLSVARVARADVAPLPAQEGTSLGTAGSTNIQMVSETVVIQVTDVTYTNSFGAVLTVTGARVTADFLLSNPSANPQSIQVGFPLNIPSQAIGYGDFAKLHGLHAFVAGTEAETSITTVGQETWSAWQMSFAPGDTNVRVTYELPATVDACSAELGYVLHTGAAWAGAIGRADLIVRYPYAAEATFVSPHGIYLGNTTPGYQVDGSDLHWHYDNLEPTAANDLAVTFVTPDCWLKVAAARVALNQHASAENYWHLASAYAEIVFPHHGFYSPLIAQVADAQFQKALSLDPANPQINTDYAEFLLYHVGYLLPASRQPDEIQQCVKALQLAPQDDQLGSTCGDFLSSVNVDPEATSLAADAATQTAAPQPTLAPEVTNTVPASATLNPSPQPTASPLAVTTPAVLPQPTETIAAPAMAQLLASPSPPFSPTPTSRAVTTPSWVPVGIAAMLVLLVVVGLIVWRRRLL
jgi:hypothetical protein